MLHRELLIDGIFLGGPCDQGIGKTVSLNPFDGRSIGTAAEGGWSEMDAALHAAKRASATWAHSTMPERAALLSRIARALEDRSAELTQLLIDEVGKPRTAAEAEVRRTITTFQIAAQLATHPTSETLSTEPDPRSSEYEVTVERRPVGVVLGIVPWNWPLNLAAHKIAPALLGGNTIVIKPSSLAPLCTLTLCRIIHEAGCPYGVLNAVHCPSPIAQKAVTDPRTDFISFTGSESVGWKLKALVPEKKVALELGGDATAYFAEDADLTQTVPACWLAALTYSGQICISLQHLLIHESRYDEAKAALTLAFQNTPTGDPNTPGILVGPVINEENAERIQSWTDEAIAKGATLLSGGQRNGTLVQATLLENVPVTVPLGCDEVFGPVLTLRPVQDDAEAIANINASRFGLQAAVFTADHNRALRLARQLEVGGVVINSGPNIRFDAMPYGGVKRSGFGREGVRYAYEEMTEPLAIVRKR